MKRHSVLSFSRSQAEQLGLQVCILFESFHSCESSLGPYVGLFDRVPVGDCVCMCSREGTHVHVATDCGRCICIFDLLLPLTSAPSKRTQQQRRRRRRLPHASLREGDPEAAMIPRRCESFSVASLAPRVSSCAFVISLAREAAATATEQGDENERHDFIIYDRKEPATEYTCAPEPLAPYVCLPFERTGKRELGSRAYLLESSSHLRASC